MMESGRVVRIAAPAKVNLTLHITGRREDGYHLLDSLVVFAGVFDRVTLAADDSISLAVAGPHADALDDLPTNDNIVVRAATLLAAASGTRQGARISLHKALPVAAGIGGGSADAAAVLRGLVRLWDLSISEAALSELGGRLGADVPVCLRGRPTLLSGIGDGLQDAPALPAAWLVLVNPGMPLLTAPVFKGFAGSPFSPAAPLSAPISDAQGFAAALAHRHNDLTHSAIALLPEIGLIIARLGALEGCLLARMSGSGATCWGLFASEAAARAAASGIRREHPGWWIEPAPLLTAAADPFTLAEAPMLAR